MVFYIFIKIFCVSFFGKYFQNNVNLKSVDPKAYEVYKRLGQADIQKILDGDVTKSFFGKNFQNNVYSLYNI